MIGDGDLTVDFGVSKHLATHANDSGQVTANLRTMCFLGLVGLPVRSQIYAEQPFSLARVVFGFRIKVGRGLLRG